MGKKKGKKKSKPLAKGSRQVTKESTKPQLSVKWWYVANSIQLIVYLAIMATIFYIQEQLKRVEVPGKDNYLQTSTYKQVDLQKLLQQAQENPGDSRKQQEAAQELEHRGNARKAIKLYRRALKLEPENTHLLLTLGTLLMNFSQHQDEAIKHLQRIIEIDPSHPKRKAIELWLGAKNKDGTSDR